MADDDRDHAVADTQKHVRAQNRNAVFAVCTQQISDRHPKIPDAEAQLLFLEEEVSADHDQLKQTGKNGSDCGTGNLHLWHTKVTKNKDPVKKDVDEETANRCVERDLYIMNRPQNQGQGHCDGHHYKRSCAVPEINCTLFDHSSVGCIDPEKLLREKQRDHHADDGHRENYTQHDRNRLFHIVVVAFAIKLRTENGCTATDAHTGDLEQVDKIICQRRTGKLYLTKAAQHHSVHNVHAHRDHILDDHRKCKHQHQPVKAWFLYQ